MTELNNTTNPAVENTPATQENQIAVEASVGFDINNLILKSEKMDKLKPAIMLSASYMELEKPSEFFDGYFIGFQDMVVTDKQSGEQKTLKAARFLKDKKVFINAGAVLINELERAKIELGTPLRVTYLRKEKDTKIYTLTLLA
jgi:hypothetical protein